MERMTNERENGYGDAIGGGRAWGSGLAGYGMIYRGGHNIWYANEHAEWIDPPDLPIRESGYASGHGNEFGHGFGCVWTEHRDGTGCGSGEADGGLWNGIG